MGQWLKNLNSKQRRRSRKGKETIHIPCPDRKAEAQAQPTAPIAEAAK